MFEELPLQGLLLYRPKKIDDPRGFFSETYNASDWERHGLGYKFVQDNHSLSRDVGTIRGLHFQSPPFAQNKLVRVLRGKILDVVVDLRQSSPTYGSHFKIELSAENWTQIFVPIGFAHGFMTLEPDTEVFYKVTNFYSASHDRGIVWNDAKLAINWPIINSNFIISEKDKRLPSFTSLESPFP